MLNIQEYFCLLATVGGCALDFYMKKRNKAILVLRLDKSSELKTFVGPFSS